jgi:hypothetical protein
MFKLALVAAAVLLSMTASYAQNGPAPGEYVNTGGRGLRYCTNFARANKCRPRWDARMTTCVCNVSGKMAHPVRAGYKPPTY